MPLPEKPVAAILMVGHLSDVRETVWGLDHLPGPSMRELDVGEHARERLFQTPIAGVRICYLPCLVILTAEDHDVVVAMRLESEIVIGIRGVPEERVSDGALPDAPGDRVAGVQRQLGLKDRRARHPSDANEWIVRRDDDLTGMDPVAVRLHAPRLRRGTPRPRCARRSRRHSRESRPTHPRGTCADGTSPDCRNAHQGHR